MCVCMYCEHVSGRGGKGKRQEIDRIHDKRKNDIKKKQTKAKKKTIKTQEPWAMLTKTVMLMVIIII